MFMRLAIGVSVIALLAACGSSPKTNFYVLTADAGTPAGPPFASSILVGPVTVPESVDQPQIVVQAMGNQVTPAEFQRWAGPLTSEIGRVIAANLGRDLNATRVWSYPQTAVPEPDIQVIVDVRRFESALGEAVTIDALWTVRRKAGGAPRTGQSVVKEPAGGADFNALAAAHSRALARVSRDIAGAIGAK